MPRGYDASPARNATLARVEPAHAPNDGSPQRGLGSAQGNEDLLVARGWRSLEWSPGPPQRICIVREPERPGPVRLTPREFELVRAVATGRCVKQAAAEIGIEWATARTRLSRGLRKLGLRTSAQLPAFWHGLLGAFTREPGADGTEMLVFESPCSSRAPTCLTSAERELLQAILRGMSSEQLARQRGTSVRTIANQLARLFRKFRASTKSELASRALGSGEME